MDSPVQLQGFPKGRGQPKSHCGAFRINLGQTFLCFFRCSQRGLRFGYVYVYGERRSVTTVLMTTPTLSPSDVSVGPPRYVFNFNYFIYIVPFTIKLSLGAFQR